MMTQQLQLKQLLDLSQLAFSEAPFYASDKQSNLSTLTLGQLLSDLTVTKIKKIKKISTSKKQSKASWTRTETQKLIELCKVFGSDFSMISLYLDKTRDQIKRRFKYLDKKGLGIDIFQSKIVEIE